MFEVREEEERKPRCFLVGEPLNDLKELSGLATTAGMEIAGLLTLSRLEIKPAYGMGSGKAEEIKELSKEAEADCIIFDFDLDPTKQRNWEKLTKIPCFDRQELIIRIFAQRARTKEAVLQVELARLSYSLPRLAHSYGDLSRQRGGSYGSKGSGETQLELDQRQVRSKINQVKKELLEVSKNRNTQRKKRSQIPVPECALVGYTNAGKSSLLNALTGAKSFVEDELFATLDPLTRKLKLKDGNGILLTDTVGFIKNLPHSLIDAFKSTLSAARDADLLLIVIDSSDSQALEQYKTVMEVLKETGADISKSLIILNKWDKKRESVSEGELLLNFPEAIKVSAKEETGFEELFLRISRKLFGMQENYEIPLEEAEIVQLIRTKGIILKEEWKDNSVELLARLPENERERFSKYRR